MKDEQAFHQARRTLVALLSKPDDGEVDLVAITPHDRINLVITCSASMIEQALCVTAHYRSDVANEGLTRLIEDMRRNIGKLCGNH
jgi:hypothetical protein